VFVFETVTGQNTLAPFEFPPVESRAVATEMPPTPAANFAAVTLPSASFAVRIEALSKSLAETPEFLM
jgi:hypothetical protein